MIEMWNKPAIVSLAIIAAALVGCGPQPVAGGTPGVLRAGGNPVSDIQITVYEADGEAWRAMGFGVPGADGAFELVTNGAAGALWLPPGEYRCTLESVGAPVRIPKEYAQVETTPLTVSWSESDEMLTLEIPALRLIR
jgi:hypothetical protein